MMRPLFPVLYPILDVGLVGGRLLSVALELHAAGIEILQFRDKVSTSREYFVKIRAVKSALSNRNVQLIVNDRSEVAAMLGASGVHLGQEDLCVEDARSICGTAALIGISTHCSEEVRRADRSSADYIALGPIFATATKKSSTPVLGLEFLREARAETRKPIVAIGGITTSRAEDVFRAGAHCVAVASDLLHAANPGAMAREYLAIAARVFGRAS